VSKQTLTFRRQNHFVKPVLLADVASALVAILDEMNELAAG
jgi:hypothetical protein